MVVDQSRLESVTTLKKGDHAPDHEFCVMEAVAYVTGEPWSAHPQCACPVLTSYAIRINDSMPSDAVRTAFLLPIIPLLANSKADRSVELARMFFLVDRAVREFVPMTLDRLGHTDLAATLRSLPEIVDRATARNAAYAASAAYAAANTAYAANVANTAYATAACAANVADACVTNVACASAAYAANVADAWGRVVEVLREAIEIR